MFQWFTENVLIQKQPLGCSIIATSACNFIKKRLQHSLNIVLFPYETFKKTYFKEHLRTTSVIADVDQFNFQEANVPNCRQVKLYLIISKPETFRKRTKWKASGIASCKGNDYRMLSELTLQDNNFYRLKLTTGSQ